MQFGTKAAFESVTRSTHKTANCATITLIQHLNKGSNKARDDQQEVQNPNKIHQNVLNSINEWWKDWNESHPPIKLQEKAANQHVHEVNDEMGFRHTDHSEMNQCSLHESQVLYWTPHLRITSGWVFVWPLSFFLDKTERWWRSQQIWRGGSQK